MARQLVFVAAFVVLSVVVKDSAASRYGTSLGDAAAPLAAEAPKAGSPMSDLLEEAAAAAGGPATHAMAGAALANAPAPAPSAASSLEVSINIAGAIVAGLASFFF